MSGFRARFLILAGSFGAALFPVAAGAKILTVMGIGEPASINSANCDVSWNCSTLRDAMNNTASGDSIRFSSAIDGQTIVLEYCSNPAAGTEFGPSAFFITGNKGILIDGMLGLSRGITIARDPFAPGCAASGSSPAFRLFDVDAGSSLSLFGLTLKNGLAQGGSSHNGGGALGAGGAIFSRGELVITQCTFSGNVAQGGSGGNSLLGYGGGGVGADATGSGGGGPNGGGSIGSNPGGFGGGGSAYDAGGAGGFGGGGGAGGAGGAGGFGGGGGANSGISSGSGGFGAGGGGTTNPSSGGGGGAGMGGAVFNDAGTLTVTNSTFTGNSALGGNSSSGAGNGSGFGGAIFNYSGTMNVTYGTLVRNSVAAGAGGSGGAADGGAIYSVNDGNCASGGNSCSTPSPATSPIIQSSILANSVGSALDLIVSGINGANTAGRGGTLNLIMNYDANQFESFRVATSAEPRLSPLGYFGGWNATTSPNSGSPVVNLIACYLGTLPASDQRGVTRPQGPVCDIGAVEYDNDNIYGNGFD